LTPTDARLAKLRSDLLRDWEQVVVNLKKAESVDPAEGSPQAALVALSLDHAYQAVETLLLRIEAALGLEPGVFVACRLAGGRA
jgi:hypothetical protein